MQLSADIQSFDLSDDEDVLVFAGTAYEWDEETSELLEPAVVRRLRRSTGEQWDLELLRLPEGSEPPAPWIRVSPSGRWTVVLTGATAHLYREGERVWHRPLQEQVEPEAGMPWRPFVSFTPDERWLILRANHELAVEAIDLERLTPRHRFDVAPDPVAPPSLCLLPDGALLLRQRFSFTRLSLPELTPLAPATRSFADRYPARDMVCDDAGVVVSFAPLSSPWYDREDRGALYGTVSARRLEGERWQPLAQHELYKELWFDDALDWELRACGGRVVAVYRDPQAWTQLVAVGFPDGGTWSLPSERRPAAFRVAPQGDAVWVADGQGLERHALRWPESPEAAARADRRRRLELLSEGSGGQWAWEKILALLDEIEVTEERIAEIERLAPRLEGWRATTRVPPKDWGPQDPRLALTPLRHVASLHGIGQHALAELEPGGRQLIVETSVRDARVRLRDGGEVELVAEARASGKGVILTPGPILRSADARTLAVALHHADPLHYCSGSSVSPIGGGQQLLILRDGALMAQLKDDFKQVDEATDDRRHAAYALSPDGTWLYVWMLGAGALSRVHLPDMNFQRSVPWPRALDLALSPDGRLLAVADYPETRILDAWTLETLLRVHVDGAPCPAARVCFDASGRHLGLVQAGPTRHALRRGVDALTLRVHRVEDGGRASLEWTRAPWPMPKRDWIARDDDPPRPTLALQAHGEEGLRLLIGEERSGFVEVVELSTLQRARLACDYQGFLAFDADADSVLIGYEREALRWRPELR